VGEEVPRPRLRDAREAWADRWHEWRGDRRIAAALLACVALAAGVAWLRSGKAPSSSLPRPTPTSSPNDPVAATTTTTRAPRIVVDVVGAVQRGGVVHLAAGARVVDAIAAAGGATADADLTRLNLAAPLADGSRVAVPRFGAAAPAIDPTAVSGAAPSGADGAPSSAAPVNLNSANTEQLEALPGVGPATAAAIISDREAHGPFLTVNDLGRVRGIGDAKLEQLRDLVAV
jgi:competence protein ComEA